MPVIPIVPGDHWEDSTTLSLTALMCYPRGGEKRDEFLVSCFITQRLRTSNDLVMPLPREWVVALYRARTRAEILEEAQDRARKGGVVAGSILLLILTLGSVSPRDASVGKAISIVGRRLIRNARPASRAHMMNAWREFKPVAHLWAALIYLDDFATGTLKNQSDGDLSLYLHPQILPMFLAIAESFRRLGERFIPLKQKTPLLCAEEMYRCPDDLELPTFQLPDAKLEAWVGHILAEYRAER